MKSLVRKLKHFLRQCGGPTAVGYAVLLVLVIFGAITAVSLLGASLGNSIGSAAEALPSGGSDEDSSESSQDEKDENDDQKGKRRRRRKGRKGRRRRRRSAANLSSTSSSLPACPGPVSAEIHVLPHLKRLVLIPRLVRVELDLWVIHDGARM